MSRRFNLITALAAVLATLVVATSAEARSPYPAQYTGTLNYEANDTDASSSHIETIAATGVKLKRFKVVTVRHLRLAYYKFVSGDIKWHITQTGDCSYTLDRSFPITSLTPVPIKPIPLTLSRPPLVKAPKFAVSGLYPVTDQFPIDQTCGNNSGTPVATPTSIGFTGVVNFGTHARGTRGRVVGKNVFDSPSDDGVGTQHFAWTWKLTGK